MSIRHPVIESALGEIHNRCVWLSMNRCESEAGDKNLIKVEKSFGIPTRNKVDLVDMNCKIY
jgi:hypothetical protein